MDNIILHICLHIIFVPYQPNYLCVFPRVCEQKNSLLSKSVIINIMAKIAIFSFLFVIIWNNYLLFFCTRVHTFIYPICLSQTGPTNEPFWWLYLGDVHIWRYEYQLSATHDWFGLQYEQPSLYCYCRDWAALPNWLVISNQFMNVIEFRCIKCPYKMNIVHLTGQLRNYLLNTVFWARLTHVTNLGQIVQKS